MYMFLNISVIFYKSNKFQNMIMCVIINYILNLSIVYMVDYHWLIRGYFKFIKLDRNTWSAQIFIPECCVQHITSSHNRFLGLKNLRKLFVSFEKSISKSAKNRKHIFA